MHSIKFDGSQLREIEERDGYRAALMADLFNKSSIEVVVDEQDDSWWEINEIKIHGNPIIDDPFSDPICTFCRYDSLFALKSYSNATSRFLVGIQRWDGVSSRIDISSMLSGLSTSRAVVNKTEIAICDTCIGNRELHTKIGRYLNNLKGYQPEEQQNDYLVSVSIQGTATVRVTAPPSDIDDVMEEVESEIHVDLRTSLPVTDNDLHVVAERYELD